ncbi:MAG: peptide chain release factor N(5)-glutamine methyltransferase [Candidatus Dormibacteraeota bacterium]|nr:peptide chain release factor N(5)-glutamine methyltransferase [Candidatus Dormibacteraeota bacterium]
MAVAERTVLDVVRLSTDYLAQHGSRSPRLDAELLCAHAWGLRRLDLYLQHDRPLPEAELAAARALVRRRAEGEPVAYITGSREFFNRTFAVDRSVLIPRPETETLVELAVQRIRSRGDECVAADLGTGSGCIAVTLAAELSALRVVATDVSDAALDIARDNATRHGVADRVTFLSGDWGDALPDAVDVVVSNPPYVTKAELAQVDRDVRDFEPRGALDGGDDGFAAYRSLVPSLRDRVNPGAILLLEVDPRRAAGVASLAGGAFDGARTSLHRDLAGNDRVVEAQLA